MIPSLFLFHLHHDKTWYNPAPRLLALLPFDIIFWTSSISIFLASCPLSTFPCHCPINTRYVSLYLPAGSAQPSSSSLLHPSYTFLISLHFSQTFPIFYLLPELIWYFFILKFKKNDRMVFCITNLAR